MIYAIVILICVLACVLTETALRSGFDAAAPAFDTFLLLGPTRVLTKQAHCEEIITPTRKAH